MNNLEWNIKNWSNRARWEKEWADGYAWGTEELVKADYSRFVAPHLIGIKNPDILEIACGMGRFTKLLLEKAHSLHSIDIQKICVDECRKRFAAYPNFTASITDGKSMPEGNFDLIVSYDSLVHADYDILKAYFLQSIPLLNKDGFIIIHHANRPNSSCSRFCVTSEMVREFIQTLSSLELVSQTLFRYTDNQFIDCVTVCKKINIMYISGLTQINKNLFCKNLNEWCVIENIEKKILLHPNAIGSPPATFICTDVSVTSKKYLKIEACAVDENLANKGAQLCIQLGNDGNIIYEDHISLKPRQHIKKELLIPNNIKVMDIIISITPANDAITHQFALVEIQPLKLL